MSSRNHFFTLHMNSKPRCWGEYREHGHLSARNIINGLLCFFAIAPTLLITTCSYDKERQCRIGINEIDSYTDRLTLITREEHPVLTVNILFFLNVTIGFWIIGLMQRNFWLIDPYWTILPPLMGLFYRFHPSAWNPPTLRANVAMALVFVWSLRLTHNYMRRECWKFGEREDWRYTKLAKENPRSWWILSFFAVGLAQQPMLVGISLPLAAVHHVHALSAGDETYTPPDWGFLDFIAVTLCLTGLSVAYFADNQLYDYMTENERRAKANLPKVIICFVSICVDGSAGLRLVAIFKVHLVISRRHPNYFGEHLWWWSLGLFAVRCGQPWMLAGTAFNSIVLLVVGGMTEERMLRGWSLQRAALYRAYRARTSPLIPLPNSLWKSFKL